MFALSCFSCICLFVTPRTTACQATLSLGFFRQEYKSGLPCSPPGDLPDPETEPMSLMSLALAGGFFTTGATWEAKRKSLFFAASFFWVLKIYLECSEVVLKKRQKNETTNFPMCPRVLISQYNKCLFEE